MIKKTIYAFLLRIEVCLINLHHNAGAKGRKSIKTCQHLFKQQSWILYGQNPASNFLKILSKPLVVAGGVAANKGLRERLATETMMSRLI